MNAFNYLAQGFATILTPQMLFMVVVGVAIGIFGGALPGVSITMTVALLSGLTYSMTPFQAVVILTAAQIGATYGGSISATVLNVPGTPAAAATALEGSELTKQGKGELALGVNVFSSFIGNNIGIIFFVLSIRVFVKLAMACGSYEMFWLGMFGILIAASLAQGDTLKALLASMLGLLVGCIGMDAVDGVSRFSYGSVYLSSGISFIPAMIGLFGLSEVFISLTDIKLTSRSNAKVSMKQAATVWWKYKWLSIKTAIAGYVIGACPGLGANVSCWIGYDMAKRESSNKELFGHGAIDALVGAETANNATVPGAYSPLLTLGIPGDGGSAIVLGILTMHGIFAGPSFVKNHPEWVYNLAVSLFIAGIIMLIAGAYFGKFLVRAFCAIPIPAMSGIITCLCIMGSYAINRSFFDVGLMFVFGIIGLLMKSARIPCAPMIIGMVLAKDTIDLNFRRGLLASSNYSPAPFFIRPICAVMILILVAVVFFKFILPAIKRSKATGSEASE